jgi:hypothetical protein
MARFSVPRPRNTDAAESQNKAFPAPDLQKTWRAQIQGIYSFRYALNDSAGTQATWRDAKSPVRPTCILLLPSPRADNWLALSRPYVSLLPSHAARGNGQPERQQQ